MRVFFVAVLPVFLTGEGEGENVINYMHVNLISRVDEVEKRDGDGQRRS